MNASPKVLTVRTPFFCFYALRGNGGIYLVDSGFVGGLRHLKKALGENGWGDAPVRGVLLTHGHLDHTFNATALQREFPDAWVAAPRMDRDLIEGRFLGAHGLGLVAGLGQQIVSLCSRYRPPSNVRYFTPGEGFDFPLGLSSVGLPGHTPGHCGFLLGGMLFAGDVFASWKRWSHRPPTIFNHSTGGATASLRKVAEMELDGIYLCHCDAASPATHLKRLRDYVRRTAG